jgi:hypothetical protein
MIANVGSLIIAFQMRVDLWHAIAFAALYWIVRSGTFHVVFTYVFTKK